MLLVNASTDIEALDEKALGWFMEADADLRAFDKLINGDEGLKLRSLFCLQQAAEKMGKAVVISYGALGCEVKGYIDEVKKVVGRKTPKVIKVIYKRANKLCDLGETAIKKPGKFGKRLGHNLWEIHKIENELIDEVFKKPERMEALINFINEYPQIAIQNYSQAENLNENIRQITRQFIEQVILKPLESMPKELREQPKYKDHQCVKEVVNHITELNNRLNEARDGVRNMKNQIKQLLSIPNCRITSRCVGSINQATDAIIDVLRIFIGGGFVMLHVVQCLSLFEQRSRYCRAEGEECPPIDNEHIKYYREVAEFLKSIEESLNKSMNKLSKVYADLQENSTNRRTIIDIVLSSPCIKEIIKCISTALSRIQGPQVNPMH